MRKYFIFLFSIVLLAGTTVYADTMHRNLTLVDNGYINPIPSSDLKKLIEIENALYGQAYADQELLARIERLENTVYNRYYPDYALDRRLSNLIYSYNRRNNLARTNRIKRIVNGINSAFVGVPTGYTPPISDPYYNGYGYGNGSYYYGNNGWGYRNSGIGTGSGVRILD